MKKLIFTIIVLITAAAAISSKVMRRQLGIIQSSVPETETLSNEKLEFVYNYSWCVDTTEQLQENRDGDRMLLQIGGNGLSKFSSYKNLTVDSIIAALSWEQISATVSSDPTKLANGEFMTIFKNYPSGKLTHTEKICQDWFLYEEDMPTFEWELVDSLITVLGYECHGAKTIFRGREWTVFYTEEIPVMDGPWKLHGLPGLIMKAEDSDGHYSFECIGINSNANRPITQYKVPFNKTDRKGFYDAKNRYEVNPYAYFETTTGGHITVTDESGNPMLDAYDPIELFYDYIEKDWKK